MSDLTQVPQKRLNWKKPTIGLTAAFVVFGFIYLVYAGVQAEYHLSRIKSQVQQANLKNGHVTADRAAELLKSIRADVSAAHQSTTGPVWWLAAHIPYLGRTPTAVRTLTSNLNSAFAATTGLEDSLRNSKPNSSLSDLKLILSLSSSLNELSSPIKHGAIEINALNLNGVPAIVANPVRQLGTGFANLAPVVQDAKMFSQIAPALLGIDRPRKWMLVFQNGAEARSIGGFPGGWGILTASAGRLKLSPLYKETGLMRQPLVNWRDYVTPEQAELYGYDLSRFSDMNISPDFPTNARLMAALEEQNIGQQVDGVLSMNEHALANFMQVTGPVKIHGREISSENAVEYVTRGVYQDYSNPKQKDAAVFSIIEKTFAKFQTGAIGPARLLQAFIPAIHSNNLHAWAKDKPVQQKILKSPIGGSLADVNNPTTAVVLINGAGNKLDAYVKAKINYEQGVCETDFPYRDSIMKVSLNNTAPTSGLPAYVTTRFDLGTMRPSNPGATKMLIYVHAPLGSVFESAIVAGKLVAPTSEGTDLDREVWRFDIELPAQATQNLVLKFAEPALGNEPRPTLWTQSMPNLVEAKVIAGLGCK
ncbi:MAG: DUF4012 domain-containing protein [Actinobacteria bacterium]|nr:DUF4012 domain-containing protein [Actinomycetota bacterium]